MSLVAISYGRLRLRLKIDRPQRHAGDIVLGAKASAGSEPRLVDRARLQAPGEPIDAETEYIGRAASYARRMAIQIA